MRVVTVCGSLAASSANGAVLALAARRAVAEGHDVVAATGLDQIGPFRPDLVDDPGGAVAGFRSTVEAADVVLVAAPEYAGGLAGVVKNALDWLVGSASLYRRTVGVASAGTSGGTYALEQLVRTLSWQGAFVVASLAVAAPRTKMAPTEIGVEGLRFTDQATVDAIGAWAARAVRAAAAPMVERLRCVAEVVEPYGIDPARFGEPV